MAATKLKDLIKIDTQTLKASVVPLSVVAVLAVFTFALVWLRIGSAANLTKARASIQSAYRSAARLAEVQNTQQRLTDKITETRNQLFTEDEVNDFVANVSELARKYDAHIISSRPKRLETYIPSSLQATYVAYDFQIEMEAEYHALGELLAELYRKPKAFKLNKLIIDGRETPASLNQISLSLIIISSKGSDVRGNT